MLAALLAEAREAGDIGSLVRILAEIAAYVMQTGPRGGRFYYTSKGRKVYRKLGGQSGKARKAPAATGSDYDRLWAANVPLGIGDGPETGRALRAMFGDRAPTPEQFAGMFSAEGMEARLVETSASAGPPPRIHAGYHVRDADGTVVGRMSREFKTGSRGPEVYHAYFRLNEAAQGGGRAGAMFGKALKAYKKMGVKKVEVSAAITVGPYAWARFGFQPGRAEMEDIRREFTGFLQQPPIGLSREQAEKIVARKGKDLHSLSGIRLKVRQLDPETGKVVKKDVKAGKDFLLHGREGGIRSWHGEADLEDPKVVARWQRQAAKGEKQRRAALASGRQNDRLDARQQAAVAAKREEHADQYTSRGRERWRLAQARAEYVARQARKGSRG